MEANVSAERLPLTGIKVVDVSSLGPGPFCSMLLADYGAEVVAVERPSAEPFDQSSFFSRGKRSVVVDLRADGGGEVVRRLAATADVFIEGYRPGVMERRGLGPAELTSLNPRLVYARITGYGQTGPYASRAGHDINFIATSGALGAIGDDKPTPPLNILGDFAGGSMNAALGIVLALLDRERTGVGQVVDAAMVDGAALLLAGQFADHAVGQWHGRGQSILSGNAPYYGAYQCADGGWFAVGAIEERFYVVLLQSLGLDEADLPDRHDPDQWPELRDRFSKVFASRPREYWEERLADVDGCGSAVLDLGELAADPHLAARGTVVWRNGVLEAAPAPRLSSVTMTGGTRVRARGEHTHAVLAEAGFSPTEIGAYVASGAVAAVQ
jgi:alpha-methylacyl-CoA racemase